MLELSFEFSLHHTVVVSRRINSVAQVQSNIWQVCQGCLAFAPPPLSPHDQLFGNMRQETVKSTQQAPRGRCRWEEVGACRLGSLSVQWTLRGLGFYIWKYQTPHMGQGRDNGESHEIKQKGRDHFANLFSFTMFTIYLCILSRTALDSLRCKSVSLGKIRDVVHMMASKDARLQIPHKALTS